MPPTFIPCWPHIYWQFLHMTKDNPRAEGGNSEGSIVYDINAEPTSSPSVTVMGFLVD